MRLRPTNPLTATGGNQTRMPPPKTVSFSHMEDGTKEEYLFLEQLEREYIGGLATRVLDSLKQLKDSVTGYQINRLEHSLQSATRASRDGASEELIVAALLHDLGDVLAPCNHGEFAASILRPYVSEETYWIVKHHGVFQNYYYAHHLGGDRNARDRYRDHPHYDATLRFCHEWDQKAFAPDYDSLPLDTFEPMVRRIFARKAFEHEHA